HQGTSVMALPVKLRFERPGTRTQGTIQRVYQTKTHGAGMRRIIPSTSTMLRQVKSQIPKSIESGPKPLALALPPPLIGGPPADGIEGGAAAPGINPGISAAFSQPGMPSVQTSVSGRTTPCAIRSRNWPSG